MLAPKQAALGKEPEDGPGAVQVQINTPSGLKTQRRFLDSNAISDIERFVAAFDISLASTPFCVRTNYPRPGVVFQVSNQTIGEAFPGTKRINLFVQKGVSSKPGKRTSVTSAGTSAPGAGVPQSTPTATPAAEWSCKACTYYNEASTSSCQICGTTK